MDRDAGGKRAVGEASVTYLFAPDAPLKIRQDLGPDIKILMFLRNPVDMAIRFGRIRSATAMKRWVSEDALAAEDERLRFPPSGLKCWLYDFAYTHRATYCPQIGRSENVFGMDDVTIFLLEEFFRDGLPQFKDLCLSLGISTGFIPEGKKLNASGTVYSRCLQNMFRNTSSWREPVKKLIPYQTRMKIRFSLEMANRRDQAAPLMSAETRKRLQSFFDADVRFARTETRP
jgi:hypothetical protein